MAKPVLKKSTAFLIFCVVVGVIGIGAYAAFMKIKDVYDKKSSVIASSDAVQVEEEINLALDSWAGNVIFRSDELRRLLEAEKIGLAVTDDGADYAGRMKALANGEFDVAVMTLDTYLALGEHYDYPGVIAFVVDVSKGGDGILGSSKVTSISSLAARDVKIGVTPNTPSDFLIKAISVHFDIPRLRTNGDWRVETDSSEDALKKLRAGAVDAAVVWEPDISKGVEAGFPKVFTTESTHGLIIDVLVMNRKFVIDRPDTAEKFVKSYFQALRSYKLSGDAGIIREIASQTGVDESKAEIMLGGIELVTLNRNASYWMGTQSTKLAELGVKGNQLASSIEACLAILNDTGVIKGDPLSGNHSSIINSSIIRSVHSQGAVSTSNVFAGSPGGDDGPSTIDFPAVSNWSGMNVIGKMKVRPVLFQSGTSILTLDGKKAVDAMAADLSHYPTYRAIVRGHTSTVGDEQKNQQLSEQRAKSVANYLIRTHDVDPDRILAEGVGGTDPLPQEPDESHRRWQGRLPRVEMILVEDPSI